MFFRPSSRHFLVSFALGSYDGHLIWIVGMSSKSALNVQKTKYEGEHKENCRGELRENDWIFIEINGKLNQFKLKSFFSDQKSALLNRYHIQ
jgi:hypothetical protein